MSKVVFKFVNNPGFGDNLRGLITLLQIQKKLRFELRIDWNNHCFRDFFYNTPPVKTDINLSLIYKNETPRHVEIMTILQNRFKRYNTIGLFTNSYPYKVEDDIKEFMKKLLVIRPEVQQYFDTKFAALPKQYHLFHYRFGDEQMFHSIDTKFVGHFISNKKENSVVISDSLSFKKEIPDVFVYLDQPYHTMKGVNFIDTLADFYLIQNAASISAYCSYGRYSGFVL